MTAPEARHIENYPAVPRRPNWTGPWQLRPAPPEFPNVPPIWMRQYDDGNPPGTWTWKCGPEIPFTAPRSKRSTRVVSGLLAAALGLFGRGLVPAKERP